jgi:hypothetical protein
MSYTFLPNTSILNSNGTPIANATPLPVTGNVVVTANVVAQINNFPSVFVTSNGYPTTQNVSFSNQSVTIYNSNGAAITSSNPLPVSTISNPPAVVNVPHCFGNNSGFMANTTLSPVAIMTMGSTTNSYQVLSYTLIPPANIKNNQTPDVLYYVWIKNPTITGTVTYTTDGNFKYAIMPESGVSVNTASGTKYHTDLFVTNNIEAGDDLMDYTMANTDVLVLCLQQLTTLNSSNTNVYWQINVIEHP